MTTQDIVVTAAKGIDTADFLEHIAWKAVIKPHLENAKEKLTKQLVDAILAAQPPTDASRERIAGQVYGIDYAIREIENIVKRGRDAEQQLAAEGIYLED